MKLKQFKTYEQAVDYRTEHWWIAQSKHLLLENWKVISKYYVIPLWK